MLGLLLIAGIVAGLLPASAQQRDRAAGPRIALVIGNRTYLDVNAPLTTPVNDARALAEELRRNGFTVEVGENLAKEAMIRAIDAFKEKLQPGTVALFYFSGFTIQLGRQNFMIPVNAQIWTEADLLRDGIILESLLQDIQARSPVKIVIVDGARRSPYERRMRGSWDGLAPLDIPEGTLALFSASPGRTANDSDGPVSPFMTELLKQIATPNITADDAFKQTRIAVSRSSNGERVPWVLSTLIDDFYFGRQTAQAPPSPPPAPPNPPSKEPPAKDPPHPPAPTPQPPTPQPPAPPPQPPAPQPPAPQPPQQPPSPPKAPEKKPPEAPPVAPTDLKPGTAFRDCADCPEMTVLAPGEFQMGSTEFDFEKPEHKVTIAKPFAIGRKEVRFAEWDLCIADGACKYRPDDRGRGRGDRPVTDVSWVDAKAFVAWLSQKTVHKYRLPSEAEWEYAARGGVNSAYWWGTTAGTGHANCADCGGNAARQTLPGGSFGANPFGLFDTAGNAAEWVEDCWNDTYRNAPKDGAAWTTGQCQQRVLRGGSFDNQARYVRSAARFKYDFDVRYYANGFRVVREIP